MGEVNSINPGNQLQLHYNIILQGILNSKPNQGKALFKTYL